ncbi:alpha/beta fold hydrolase [Leucothrix sargassi]|nr:alpha/beta fold hydrolase [Leucothrix sargassi]
MPLRRDHSGDPVNAYEATAEAWGLAWRQMFEIGNRVVKSSAFLADVKADDVKIAETPSEVVFEIDKVRLLRYKPLTEPKKDADPIMICYGLFGRQTMIDLQEDRSLVRNLLMDGLDVYVVDWGNPTRADQYLTFDDYIDLYLGSCVEHLVERNNGKPVKLFGICEGGTFAVSLAALRPELLSGLALAITPIDFKGNPEEFWAGEGFLNTWFSNLSEDDVNLIIDTYGMLPGPMTGAIFSSLSTVNSLTKYNLGLSKMEGNEAAMLNFLRMEKWIADRPDHPGEAARQWLNELYRENRLVKGTFEVCGEKVDLNKITCPVLNIYAMQDHIIPVSCSKALRPFIAPESYEEIGFPGGHVGVFVSRKAQGVVAGGIIDWINRTSVEATEGVAEETAEVEQVESAPAEPVKASPKAVSKPAPKAKKAAVTKPAKPEPVKAKPDDLTKIKGIGAVLQAKLNDAGIFLFQQVADLSASQVDELDQQLKALGRIQRDDWMGQAKRLLEPK